MKPTFDLGLWTLSPDTPTVEAHDLVKTFGPHTALSGVNLHVEAGEWVTLVGPNGAGKTTLLRILATLARPTSGDVRIFGLDARRYGLAICRQLGFLSHRTLLYDDLTAVQNLAFYSRVYGLADGPARSAVMLDRLHLTARQNDLVVTYSRGMQQRLAVARAMLHRPRLLLLDEPYTGLDLLAAEALTRLLAEINAAGCTILLTTHTLEGAVFLGRRTVVLRQGRVIHDAPMQNSAVFPHLYRRLIAGECAGTLPPSGAARHAVGDAPAPVESTPVGQTGAIPYWQQIWAVVAKDLAAEMHTREILGAMFVFAALVLLIFSFALDLHGAAARAAAPGVLWCAITFAGTLGLSRSLAREQHTGGLSGLLLAPLDHGAIFLGKALGNWLLMLALEVVLLPLGMILFDVSLLSVEMAFIFFAGTLGYAAVGTLMATIAVNTRAREVLMPILLLPLVAPLLIAAVRATGGLLDGLGWAGIAVWRHWLVVYDLLIVAVSMFTFGYVVGDS
ncbi:MAG: heme ABC exporter ATP-binding protein CcmA [Anaerolineae bacterium]|nr:heme ABC exporter ATP-binding protein CcmA [Anaerolineae bacterium]